MGVCVGSRVPSIAMDYEYAKVLDRGADSFRCRINGQKAPHFCLLSCIESVSCISRSGCNLQVEIALQPRNDLNIQSHIYHACCGQNVSPILEHSQPISVSTLHRIRALADMSSKFKELLPRRKKEPPELDDPTKDGPQDGLQLLYDGADPHHPDVDFVAVHGVGGHPVKSFTDAETGCCWLRDLLPSNSPHCRVFSYGYSADFPAKASTSIFDHARSLCWTLIREQGTIRRRIFICHNLGGLLVKCVLIEAQRNPQFNYVYKSTSGIVFLGTPHRGRSSADLALSLTKIARVDLGTLRFDVDLLRELKSNSSQVNEINQMFAHVVADSLLIGSFYETQPTKHIGIIVERSSAVLDLKSESRISLHANHAGLNKFRGHNDPNHNIVRNLIDKFRETALLADVASDKSPTSLSASPSQESLVQWNPCIASKKGETSMGLLEMAGSMEQPKDYLDAEVDIVAVHGLRGSPVRSWTNKSPQTMWLRDMLQVDVSTSRVMSYGYRTEGVLRRKKFDLDRLAEDLVDRIIDARAGILNSAVRIAESQILQGLRRTN